MNHARRIRWAMRTAGRYRPTVPDHEVWHVPKGWLWRYRRARRRWTFHRWLVETRAE